MNWFCDGAFNKKGAFYCVVDDNEFVELKKCNAKTCNEAEYMAMIRALELAYQGDTIFADSQLVVNQLTKGWKVKAKNLKKLWWKAHSIIHNKHSGHINIKWISRDFNKAGKLLEIN